MQIGFVGLGKMGGNMVHRIHRDSDHEVVAFDFDEEAVSEAEGHGATGAALAGGPGREARARRGWCGSWCRPATRPQQTVDEARQAARPRRHDHRRRQLALDRRQAPRQGAARSTASNYVDVGVSGGVWGLEVGYCMMVGGPDEAVKRLAPILDVLAPPTTARPHRRRAGCTSARPAPGTT